MWRTAIRSKYSKPSRYPFRRKNAAKPESGEERQHDDGDIDPQGEGGEAQPHGERSGGRRRNAQGAHGVDFPLHDRHDIVHIEARD
jgi:hypothetical protein